MSNDAPINTEATAGFWQSKAVQEVWSFLKTLAVIIVLVILIRGTIIEPFKIPSGSMIPTLRITDHILVSKLSYGLRLPFITYTLWQYAAPQRGDVVVFTRPDESQTPEDESDINLIKRVVALPGETVEVRDMTVYINGKPLAEPYARWYSGGVEKGQFGPATVPAGRIFLLGDNRDDSKDARYWKEHFLEIGRVKGRALLIYWTWDPNFISRVFRLIK